MAPKVSGKCDSCKAELIQRKDDKPEVIKKRLEVFLKENESLLDFYKREGKLIQIDGNGNKDQVFERIKKRLA
jgi:adenylate kinase